MPFRTTSYRLLRSLVLVLLTLFGGMLSDYAPGAPAPKSNPYALLYVPKKTSQFESTQYRRRQIDLFKTNSAPFVLFWAIRSLKNTDLPSLPKKGKGGDNRHNNEEDIAWLVQNLKVEYLDGTGVLRISLAAGTRREQVLVVNAVVNAYFQLDVDRQKQLYESHLEGQKKMAKHFQGEVGAVIGERKQKLERRLVDIKDAIRKSEEELRTLPRLLELAEVPPE